MKFDQKSMKINKESETKTDYPENARRRATRPSQDLPRTPPRPSRDPQRLLRAPPGPSEMTKKGLVPVGSHLGTLWSSKPAPRSPPRDNSWWFLVDFRRFLLILQYLPRDIAIFLVWAGLRPPQNGPSKSFTPKRERPKNTVFLTSAQKVNFPTISVGFKNRVRHGPQRVLTEFLRGGHSISFVPFPNLDRFFGLVAPLRHTRNTTPTHHPGLWGELPYVGVGEG